MGQHHPERSGFRTSEYVSGARDMNPKGVDLTVKKIVSAVEQFLQANAQWRW